MIRKQLIADIAFCVALAALAVLPFAANASSGPTGFTENKGQIMISSANRTRMCCSC